MMSMTLSPPIGAPGNTTLIKMRLDDAPGIDTRWVTNAAGETRIEESERADPLQLLFRIAGNNHRLLRMEARTRQLQFDLDGASTVLFQMLDTCVKPAMGIEVKSRKRGRR